MRSNNNRSGTGKPVYALHPVTRRVMKEFKNAESAAESLKVSPVSIRHAAVKYRVCKGYRIVYKEDYSSPKTPNSGLAYKTSNNG